ncbi:MAG: FAD-dependent oxidoreductase, partial [Desulfobacteraceae bacterium]
LDVQDRGVVISFCYPDGRTDRVLAGLVVNAAGVEADRIARMIDPDSPYALDPIRGESYKFYSHRRPDIRVVGRNVYPTPEAVETPHGRHFTVGVHLTPTFEDLSFPPRLGSTVTVGPRLVPAPDRDAWSGTPVPAESMAERVVPYFPGLRTEDLIWHQAGLQARLSEHPDFVLLRAPSTPNVIHLLGIDSPGLTACLALARRTADRIREDSAP